MSLPDTVSAPMKPADLVREMKKKKTQKIIYRRLGAMEVVTSVIKRNKAEEAQVGMEGVLLFLCKLFREGLCSKITLKKTPEEKQGNRHSGYLGGEYPGQRKSGMPRLCDGRLLWYPRNN